MELGILRKIDDLRKVWPHEAAHFTPWLAKEENLALLGETIGLDITLVETESKVGTFNVDILACESDTDRPIIIENQLEDTDHDHLGKLITYAAGKSAEVIIWVVKKARAEHRAAVEWLNNHTDNDIAFFLIEVELYQIGDSAIAPHFSIVEKPNDWAKALKVRGYKSLLEQERYDYWEAFYNYAFSHKEFEREFRARPLSYRSWIAFSIGTSRCHLEITQNRKEGNLVAQLLIRKNKELYYHLENHKEDIEKALGETLEWHEMEDKLNSRIAISMPVDYENKKQWEEQFEWAVEKLLNMKGVFRKYL